ncbi:hypothetical protein K2P47_04890 [Patescibacteria group bacterium]|nr:hypothetical protein [Patescibacteria group bacterium]
MQSYKSLTLLSLVLVLLASYQFIGAQWQGPTGVAPANNTDAPINVSASYQAKLGDLGSVRVRSGAYCDEAGENCFTNDQIYNMMTMMASSGPNCTYETTTVVGCQSAPACPAGYTAIGAASRQVASCGTSNQHDRYTQTCGRNVCQTAALLVNGQHNETQCTALGGTVIVDGTNRFCRFNQSSCPSGWAAFQQWSTFTAGTVSGTCQKDGSPVNYTTTCNASRGWANAAAPTGATSQCGMLLTCTPPRTQIGCY